MNTRMVLSLGLSALVLGGTTVGCAATGGGIASAGSDTKLADKTATRDAQRAAKALAARDATAAIGFAEGAVGFAPRNAAYRALLGQSYLQAGRFVSARDAFADALTLAPGNGRTALNLALAQIATGDWHKARETLDAHAAIIPAADRGLALALAGDPATAVKVLTELARSPQTSVKARQNLGLSLALGGDWQSARVVAAADLSPADVDKRLQEWMVFAQPHTAADQVASLLGVTARTDGGQPVALALSAPAPVAAPIAAAPVEAAAPTPMPTPVAVAQPPATIKGSGVTFAARREIVQSVPATLLRPTGPTKIALGPVRAVAASPVAGASGAWFVQLGAFENAGVARDAWSRAAHRDAALAGRVPNGTMVKAKAGALYRLSIGGFARADADALCHRYRVKGGACFVRKGAGDAVAAWVRKGGVQVASR